MAIVAANRPPPLNEDSDEDEIRERYDFEIDETVNAFTDEPSIRHDVYPESSDEEDDDDEFREREFRDIRRGNGNLYKGQVFFSPFAFKEAVLDHALCTGCNIQQYRYDKNKLAFMCVGGECKWRVWCSMKKGSDKWKISVLEDKHSCVPNGECEMLKVPVIARLFVDKIRDEPQYFLPMKMEELIMEKWKISVTRPQCQSARNKALRWIEKAYDEQFERLRDYGAEIVKSNPNSTVDIETLSNEEGLDVFNRFYLCFDSVRRSWQETCRPLIGLDGCFLRGKMKGQLLVALGRDGDNAIYPIAWGIVQVENFPNWLWFVKKLKTDLNLSDGKGYVMVSDRQKGLIKAVSLELPNIEHRMCVRHIYGNLKANHGKKAEMKPLVWNLAWSYNEGQFRENLKNLMEYDRAVYEDVMKSNPRSWCRAFYKIGSYCEDVENNSTESFNSTLIKAREKPLVPMLDIIARLAMVRIFKRSVESHDHQALCTPYAKKFLDAEHKLASMCKVYRSTHNQYQVYLGPDIHRVNMEKWSCSCQKWDITGIPCEHAYGVILHRNLEAEDFVCHWFRTALWRRTYTDGITPIQGVKFWPTGSGPKVHQPPEPPQPGRKKKSKKQKRMKGKNESPTKKAKKRIMHCGICCAANHNSRFHKDETARNGSQVEPSQGVVTQAVVTQGES